MRHQGVIDSETLAFDAFYEAERPGLVRLAHLLSGSTAMAEDLAQEALLATHGRWTEIDNPPGYARRALVNLVRSYQRRQFLERRHGRSGELRHALPPEIDETWTAVRALPPDQRAVVVLRFYEDLTIDQISEILDKPSGTVKSVLHRAMRRMKDVLT